MRIHTQRAYAISGVQVSDEPLVGNSCSYNIILIFILLFFSVLHVSRR